MRRRLHDLVTVAAVLLLPACRDEMAPLQPSAPTPETAIKATSVPTLAFREVSAGGEGHTCGVTTDSVTYCWGENEDGQLGNGTNIEGLRPVRVHAGGLRFLRVRTGGKLTCGVATGNVAYCWGSNGLGMLGDGTTTDRSRPVAVAGGLRFRQVDPNHFHTCGVTPDNVSYCWGVSFASQNGFEFRRNPVAVPGGFRFRQVSTGGAHTCAVTASDVAYCWGENFAGQLGDGTQLNQPTPVKVVGGLRFQQVSANGDNTCGLTTTNVAYCWGSADRGQLGNGTSTGPEICGDLPCSKRPVRVAGRLAFRTVSVGSGHTCALTTSDVAYCWGHNFDGQLGNGTRTGPETCVPFFGEIPCSRRPVRVVRRLAFDHLDAGVTHTCGVTTTHVAYCWGDNLSGQLGIGTRTGPERCFFGNPCSSRPVRVHAPRPEV
jgi:alpha-tubulin suppressor-like RCC1 family protein